MINKTLKRAIAASVGVGLAFAGLVGVAAPAQAVDDPAPSTTFKVHLNVPAEVAADWNIWSWGGCANATDNTIGELEKNVGTVDIPRLVTMDWTPNFTNDDAYGSYAEFTMPCAVESLNNVLRTTESWDGRAADDAATPPVVAIPAADKPLGGDNVFPAGESWWNVNTGLREYPDQINYRVHVNAPLKTLQSQGWNFYTFGGAGELALAPVLSSSPGYKGVVNKDIKGWPFVGSDSYGSYADLKIVGDPASVGIIIRRSGKIGKTAAPANGWGGPQSPNYEDLVAGKNEYWITLGSGDWFTSKPYYVGRYGATATYANGKITVTPVRPSHISLKGAMPDKIVVTIKKGLVSAKCTITNNVLGLVTPSWALPASCDIPMKPGKAAAEWNVFVQGSNTGVGAALVGPQQATKVTVPKK